MIDPLFEAHLFLLLTHHGHESVTTEDICWFHAGRALRVIREARLKPDEHGRFIPTAETAVWIQRMFKELRHVDTANLQRDLAPRYIDYEPHESIAAEEELPAPVAREAAGAADEIAWADHTPFGSPALAG